MYALQAVRVFLRADKFTFFLSYALGRKMSARIIASEDTAMTYDFVDIE